METVKNLIEKLPQYEKQARETDETLKKIALIVAQNQLLLKKIAQKLEVEP